MAWSFLDMKKIREGARARGGKKNGGTLCVLLSLLKNKLLALETGASRVGV